MAARLPTGRVLALIAGFLGGVAFVIACPNPSGGGTASTGATADGTASTSGTTLGPGTATAATGGEIIVCNNWQLRIKKIPVSDSDDQEVPIPNGWEPFQAGLTEPLVMEVMMRSCAD